MQLEEFNSHRFHTLIQEIRSIREEKPVFEQPDGLELAFIVDSVIDVENDLAKVNAFLVSVNDLNNISNNLQHIINYLKQINLKGNISYIAEQIRAHLLNIMKITAGYPRRSIKNTTNDFNKIAHVYKQEADKYKEQIQKELVSYKSALDQNLQESNKNKEYLNNLVGDIKEFSSKYTTKEKAKYYSDTSAVSEQNADKFLRYTNRAMFCALGFIVLPIIIPMLCNIFSGTWEEIFPSDILNLSFGGAILRISISFLALLPALFFSQIEKVYRERSFKFRDLSNAILSINPYLADIEQNQYGNYSEKDQFKIEMAKIFFTQIHSNDKHNDRDLLKKLEQISNIVKGIGNK